MNYFYVSTLVVQFTLSDSAFCLANISRERNYCKMLQIVYYRCISLVDANAHHVDYWCKNSG